MKLSLLIAMIIGGLLPRAGAFAQDLKYADLESLTLQGNSSVRAGELRREAQSARTGYLWKSFLPTLGVVGGYERFQTGRYPTLTQPFGQTGVRLNLFNGFRDQHESRLREAKTLIARAETAVQAQEKMSEVRRLYLQLAYNKELKRIHEEILKENEAARQSARFRLKQGMVGRTDVLEFEIFAGQLREQIESVAHEMEILSLRLSAALGMESVTDLNPVDPLQHVHQDELVKRDFRGVATAGALLISAEESSRMAESAKASSWWLPSLDLYSEYALFTLRDRDYLTRSVRDDWAAGVQFSWTFFNANAIADSRASLLERKASQADATQKHRDYLAQVKSIQEEMVHLHELVHTGEERVQQGAEYLNSTRSDYQRGVKNSPDVIGAIGKQVGFQKELIERKLAYQQARDRLLSLTQSIGN